MFTKLKRSLIPTLPNVTEIREGVEELIDDVALGNMDELVDFLRPDILRVSLVILQKLGEIPSQGDIFLR